MNTGLDKTLPLVPGFLNEPEKFIRWTFGELSVFLGPLLVVGFFCSWILGLILGLAFYKGFSLLTRGPYGDLLPALEYWFLPFSRRRYRAIAPSYIREWLG